MNVHGWKVAALLLIAGLTGCGGPVTRSAPPGGVTALPPGWAEFAFPGKRRTAYAAGFEDGRPVVHAHAVSSASMLRRTLRVPASEVAGVTFSWRAPALIAGADFSDADASDSPVRIVLAFDGDASRLSARNRMLFDLAQALTGEAPPYATLMYVWDTRAPRETVFHSMRTDRVRKIVVESGAEGCGRWLHYRRDVQADYRRVFGEEPGVLIGIALMSDTDNTRSTVDASYGEVRLLGANGTVH